MTADCVGPGGSTLKILQKSLQQTYNPAAPLIVLLHRLHRSSDLLIADALGSKSFSSVNDAFERHQNVEVDFDFGRVRGSSPNLPSVS